MKRVSKQLENRMRYMHLIKIVYAIAFTFSSFQVLFAEASLSCKNVRQITGALLQSHYSVHRFTEELSAKTLNQFITALDPGKLFLLEQDVNEIKKAHTASLASAIEKENCSPIETIFGVYANRFEQRRVMIDKLIDAKYDFSVNEHLYFKLTDFAKDDKEVEERWRLRIKFQLLRQKNIDIKKKSDLANITKELHKEYELASKRQKETDKTDVYGMFLQAFANSLDPHSDYFTPTQVNEFRISTSLSLEGIGALLRSEQGITKIHELMTGGAAQKSKLLQVDDKIIAVAQGNAQPVNIIDMDLPEVVKLIRGPRGTVVKLTVQRGTKEMVVPITREEIKLEDRAAKSSVYQIKAEADKKNPEHTYQVGVIDLPSFYVDFDGLHANKADYRSSSRDVANEIDKLKKQNIDALIIDLRSNGGGSLEESINIAGLFNGDGPVVQVKSATGEPNISTFRGEAKYTGPLVLLIDHQSASASEILAGAIRDYNRGIIVGDSQTFGKGTVQSMRELSEELGAIKETISMFYRPEGESTQMRGVRSHVLLPSLGDEFEIGERHYDFPLPFEKIKAVPHKNFDLTDAYLPRLRVESNYRVRHSKLFKTIDEAIDKYRENKEDRLRISLKEKSQQEKNKEEEELKKEGEKGGKQDKDPLKVIKDDAHLQEAVYIAADYVRLIEGKEIASTKIVGLPEGKPAEKKKPTAKKK